MVGRMTSDALVSNSWWYEAQVTGLCIWDEPRLRIRIRSSKKRDWFRITTRVLESRFHNVALKAVDSTPESFVLAANISILACIFCVLAGCVRDAKRQAVFRVCLFSFLAVLFSPPWQDFFERNLRSYEKWMNVCPCHSRTVLGAFWAADGCDGSCPFFSRWLLSIIMHFTGPFG